MNSSNKRNFRNILIFPRFQLGLLSVQAVILSCAALAVVLENAHTFAKLKQMGVASGLAPNHAYFKFIDMQSDAFLKHTIVAYSVALAFSSAITLYISFKLAGPIKRLMGFLQEISESRGRNFVPLKFRNGDFYSELPHLINKAFETILKPQLDKNETSYDSSKVS